MNNKRIMSTIGAAVLAASMALSGIPAFAAVTTMSDGGRFDAAYYAATYPDVVAALGTDANVLYQHYKTFGVKEGRQPYAAGTTTAVTTQAASTALTSTEIKNAKEILNKFLAGYSGGGSYHYVGSLTGWKICNNHRYTIADINQDGVKELYVSDLLGWYMFNLQTGEEIGPVTRYNQSLNLYYAVYGLVDAIVAYNGVELTQIDTSSLTEAQYNALVATFTDIGNLATTEQLTKASINKIK